jgi:glutaminyl-peptide cyclotransferase
MRLLIALSLFALLSCTNGASVKKPAATAPGARPAASQQSEVAGAQPPTPPPATADVKPAKEAKPAVALSQRFNAANAWMHLHQQVSMGPRVPGSKSHLACLKYLQKSLLQHCDAVEQQEFQVSVNGRALPMVNIIGRFNVAAPRRILLAAHWDSRPTADMNPEGQRNQPIAGANDGASGVAVLLELARVSREAPPEIGVDLVLFDGEDYGPGLDMMFLGAKHFASRLTSRQVAAYNYGILLDMIGDRQLDIRPENNSEAVAGDVYAVALSLSEKLGYRAFKEAGGITIMDDHLPLIARGVRMYDFIDFNYDYWHTTQDTEDKCGAQSLEAVGRVVENMVYRFPDIYAPK